MSRDTWTTVQYGWYLDKKDMKKVLSTIPAQYKTEPRFDQKTGKKLKDVKVLVSEEQEVLQVGKTTYQDDHGIFSMEDGLEVLTGLSAIKHWGHDANCAYGLGFQINDGATNDKLQAGLKNVNDLTEKIQKIFGFKGKPMIITIEHES